MLGITNISVAGPVGKIILLTFETGVDVIIIVNGTNVSPVFSAVAVSVSQPHMSDWHGEWGMLPNLVLEFLCIIYTHEDDPLSI